MFDDDYLLELTDYDSEKLKDLQKQYEEALLGNIQEQNSANLTNQLHQTFHQNYNSHTQPPNFHGNLQQKQQSPQQSVIELDNSDFPTYDFDSDK